MMLLQCIALFLCSVGLPAVAVKTVGTVQNAANLENYVVDTASGNWLPVQYSMPQEPKPVTTSGTTTTGQSNYVVLNPAYLGSDPLRNAILAQPTLDNSIVSTTNQQPQPTNQPPVPVQNFVPQTPSTSTPAATLVANSNQEPPKRTGGMTFTVATGPGTNSNFQTFGSPPLIIFAPQNPTSSLMTSTAANTGNIGSIPINTPAPTSGTNTVTNPSTSTAPNPTVPTTVVTRPQPLPTTSGNNPPSTPVPTTTSPVEPTSTITRNPFGTILPVTDPTFQPNGVPTIISTIADPTTTSNLIPSTAPPALTGEQLTQILSSTKNPPTNFELPTNGGNPNPIGTTTGTGPVGVNTPQPEPEPQPQTTTPQGVRPGPSSLATTTATNQNQPTLNPFLTPSVSTFLGNPAPIDPNVISALQPNAVGSGSITSTSTPSTNVGTTSFNTGSTTNAGAATTVGSITSTSAPSTNGGTTSSNTGSPTNAGTVTTVGSTTTGPMISTIMDLIVTATGPGTTSSSSPSATTQATTGTPASGVTLAAPGVTTTGTNGMTVTPQATMGTTTPIASLASLTSTVATANTPTTPQPVNPIDTILTMVANKKRVPELQASIDRQIGIFTKYLNGQTAYYQKTMDRLQSLLVQLTTRKASSTAALTNIRGLLSGMITRPSQKITLENLLRAASTIQNLKDQVSMAQSQNSIARVRTLILEAARVANVKI